MKQLQVLLLEDQQEEARETVSFLHNHDYKVTHVKSLEEAEIEIENHFFDVIILDIMINGKPEGITFAQQLKSKGISAPFLFLTNIQSKSIFDQAKESKPFSYLLKPYNNLELLFSIELAIETYYEQANTISFTQKNAILSPNFLFIKKGKSVVKVEIDSIHYIEVKDKYCNLICDQDQYQIKLSLTKTKETLAKPEFKQVHRNFLVNLKKIKEIYFEDNLIIMDTNEKIPFSERYKAFFLKGNNTIFR
ncbi:response regulator transcription factor [Aquimarina gracilis]|uniref:Response regulator transcription factor n=1 Tax=Aquimarina gracilis TaxID=874422 RepID=A0ABU5ZRD0_9FLAO|nr:response regulator transcription factor [Aquimarina gracilis]MEB3344604.1 response regulator transcription factor [Aquimarina gracilis]